MAQETIFSKIIRKEIPADILYQDDLVTAFRDIQPKAKTHILIVPNVLIPTVNDVEADHELALGRMFTVARKLAADAGIAEDGYRLIMNCNRHGGQEVYHIHLHLVGGQPLGRRLMWWNFVGTSKARIEQAAQAWDTGDGSPGMAQVPGETERIPLPERRQVSANRADF